jgi:methionine synthase I (cobalamin-dependent)
MKPIRARNQKCFDFNLFSFAKRINRPLILDGATGSLLLQKRFVRHPQLWMSYINLIEPEEVIKIHKAYINAGVDIITTNTFRTNPSALKNSNIKIHNKEFVKRSVELAQEAVENLPVLIAGSNAPVEDCYQIARKISGIEIKKNHSLHIEYLLDSGCDFILNETQSHFDEIKFICSYCSKNDIPFVMSLFFTDELKLLSGEDLFETINFILDYNPIAIGFNCILPKIFKKAFRKFDVTCNWGFYLNCGSGDYSDDNISCGINPADYISQTKNMIKAKPSFVGACCGSNQNHIKEIKKYLDAKNNN